MRKPDRTAYFKDPSRGFPCITCGKPFKKSGWVDLFYWDGVTYTHCKDCIDKEKAVDAMGESGEGPTPNG